MRKHVYEELASVEDFNWWFLGRQLCIKTILDSVRFTKKSHVLDIGCGTGGTTRWLQRYGQIVGVDESSYAVSFAKNRGIRVQQASANYLPFPENTFDLVTLLDVLYHSHIDEKKALQEAFRVLKNNGKLLVTDCAHPVLWRKHDEVVYARCRYTKTHLARVMESAGFEIEKITYIFMLPFPFFLAQYFLSKITHKYFPHSLTPKTLNTCFYFLMVCEARLLKYSNLPIGSSLLVLAKKTRKTKK